LSLKSDIDNLKNELSAEEKFLESSIKAERVFKKYKNYIFATIIVAILGVIGYQVYAHNKAENIKKANIALNTLLKEPDNTEAQEELKKSSPKLYDLYLFKNAISSNNQQQLKEIASSKDSFRSKVASYEEASQKDNIASLENYADSGNALKDLALIQASYLLIKEGKYQKAKTYLEKIPDSSMLSSIAGMYKHYLITKVKQ